MTGRRRAVPALAAGLLALAAGAGVAPAAHAAGTPGPTASGACTAQEVTVLLDPGPLGGPTRALCAPAGGTGLEVLRAAGVGYGFVPRVPGMVCTLDGAPDPCNGAPVDAYWSYWHRGDGQWEYSIEGPATYRPQPGGTEGWAFGAGDPPGGGSAAPTGAAPATAAPAAPTTAAPARQPDDAPSGPPVGVLVAGGLVLGLGAAAALRAGRRRSEP
jgi:hypothetical protein